MRVFAVIFLLVGFGCSRNTNDTTTAIAEHRQKYIALGLEYKTNYPAILNDEPRRYALVQAQMREHDALVSLGYLAETNIPLRGEWSQDLGQALFGARLSDMEVVTITMPITNNGVRVVRVRARPADIEIWKRIIEKDYTK